MQDFTSCRAFSSRPGWLRYKAGYSPITGSGHRASYQPTCWCGGGDDTDSLSLVSGWVHIATAWAGRVIV